MKDAKGESEQRAVCHHAEATSSPSWTSACFSSLMGIEFASRPTRPFELSFAAKDWSSFLSREIRWR